MLRNFAKNLEGWLDMAMANVAKEMVHAKVMRVVYYCSGLLELTSALHVNFSWHLYNIYLHLILCRTS